MFLYVYRTPHHMRSIRTAFPINTNREAQEKINDRIMWIAPADFWLYLKYKIFNVRIKNA